MRLALPFASPWDVKQAPDGRMAAILPGPANALPDAIVTFGPLIVKPDEPRLWVDQTVRSDLPRGVRVNMGRSIDQVTKDGWALRLVESEVVTEKGELVELRWCAFYTFLEHAAVAIVRSGARERFAANADAIGAVLIAGRPDWRAHPLSVADAWDLEPPRTRDRAITKAQPSATEAFEQEIARVAALSSPTALDQVQRGIALASLSRPDEALDAARAALAIDPSCEAAHYLAGTVLGGIGKHAEAIVEWTHALATKERVDTHYNIGQAHYTLGELESALTAFRAANALDPDDVLLRRKIAQCLYALGRFDEGRAARLDLVRAWNASRDPRVRNVKEFVFDQIHTDAFRIHALEPLEQRMPGISTLLEFRAVTPTDQPLNASVLVETSDHAKQAGTPYVIGVKAGAKFSVVATLAELPPYPELRDKARELLAQALRPTPPS